MAAKQYLTKINGKPKLASAVDSSAGAGNAGDIVALGATGTIAGNMMPAGYGVDIVPATLSEDVSAGNWISRWRRLDSSSLGMPMTQSSGVPTTLPYVIPSISLMPSREMPKFR